MTKKSVKKPRDINQLAKLITDVATGEVCQSDTPLRPPKAKNPAESK